MKSLLRVVVVASVVSATTSSSYGQVSVKAVGGTNPHPMAVGGTNPHPMAMGFGTFVTVIGALLGL